jgi:hypothetical protein
MKTLAVAILLLGACAAGMGARAADPQPSPPEPAQGGPVVPDAAPGVFTLQQRGPTRFRLTVTGHAFTSREAIENYLAWRAARLTMEKHFSWFSFVESRAKGDTAPVPRPDPAGPRYSFRLAFFRPVWRYKTTAPPMQKWSPFSGAAFFPSDPKIITQYEVSADIVLHKGMVADDDPLAFDASALSEFLTNQVAPPQ